VQQERLELKISQLDRTLNHHIRRALLSCYDYYYTY